MLHNGRWSKHNEKMVVAARDFLIKAGLDAGQHVIVDDTNLHPRNEAKIRADNPGVHIETKFFDVTPGEAIERDLKRPVSVGAKVILSMYDEFLKPDPPVYVQPEGKPRAIIVDLDGTLAHMDDRRGPYEWDRVGLDRCDTVVSALVHCWADMDTDPRVIAMTGRDSSCRDVTIRWLIDNDIPYHKLLMRAEGDQRKDSVVKRELFQQHIAGQYQIDFVLDDRNQVVDMWRNELGLKCLQVAEGDF